MDRELAHVEKILEINPIEGADNVELATVLGWRVMVKKGQFHPGDLGVYIEIDSRCPKTEAFAFLEKKHYAVKTQKYFKGTVLSQGLLMHPEDLGLDPSSLEEGQGLTEKLGITYYEPEDTKRKAPSVDKYKKMAQRHQRICSSKFGRWLMCRSWGKKLLFFFLGRKRDKKGGWPEWVVKTDETRCLAGKTKIATDRGDILLSTIVNRQLPVKVKSVNKDGEIEYKPIVSYQKYPSNEELLDIEFIQCKKGDTKHNRIVCSKDHKFYINGEYKRADELTINDRLTRLYTGMSSDVFPALLGIMLGDGCAHFDKRSNLARCIFSFTQGVNHKEYFDLIKNIFGIQKDGIGISGYTGENSICRFSFSDANCEDFLYTNGALKNRRFYISDEICKYITPMTLAIWYMDDGTLRHRDELTQRPTGEISTNRFSKEENERLMSVLQSYGIKTSLKFDSCRGFYSIYISVDGIEILSEIIAKYVPPCMRYKITKQADEQNRFDSSLWDTIKTDESLITCKITNIKPFVNHTNGYHVGNIFDIEVADNHNFFANGILTHNCQNMPWIVNDKSPWVATEKVDGTSATYTMKRGRRGKNDFYVCSRNVVQEDEGQKTYYDNVYWEICKKYKIEEALPDILQKRPDLDWVTIHGEIYGEGIQKRSYSMKGHNFMAFNLIYSNRGRLSTQEMTDLLMSYGIPCVPIVDDGYILPDTIDELLEHATGESVIDGGMREGLVFRSQDGTRSFKAVSNEYLLKYH